MMSACITLSVALVKCTISSVYTYIIITLIALSIFFTNKVDIYPIFFPCVFFKGSCKAENGECEHIFVPLGQSRICQCSFGFVLDNNMETCSSGT